jgi:signal transduction histidine kinase
LSVSSTNAHVRKSAHPTVAHSVESLLLEERTRWAMRIHDGLTQSVTSAVLEVQTLRQRIETDPVEAVAALREIEDAIRSDLREIREILFELQEGNPHVEPPLAGFVNDLANRWKLSAVVSIESDLGEVAEPVLEAAHGILAEALANVARHAGTTGVGVRVHVERETLTIEVEDRGRGIPMIAVTDKDQHFGLQMMRARAEETGGSIDIRSTPGSGTLVVAALPVGVRGERR